jgi:hypothetical protein
VCQNSRGTRRGVLLKSRVGDRPPAGPPSPLGLEAAKPPVLEVCRSRSLPSVTRLSGPGRSSELTIALLILALVLSERGGRWTSVFPAFLVLALAGALLYRRLRRERDGPRSGERLTQSGEHHSSGAPEPGRAEPADASRESTSKQVARFVTTPRLRG